MNDDAQRWREKYLQSLEQQDQVEARWNARVDLLRRSLVRSSLAVEGADKAVDQCMLEMRELLRQGDLDAGLSALVPRLEKAVLDSETRRQARIEQLAAALQRLVSQLLELPLPREVSKPLKRFSKTLQERAAQARELPALLAELSELQHQALSQLAPEQAGRASFLQRLFGAREAVAPSPGEDVSSTSPLAAADTAPAGPPVAEAHALAVETARSLAALATQAAQDVLEAEPTLAPPPQVEAGSPEPEPVEQGDPEFALPASPEPGYSVIAEHVEATLRGLLDELKLPEHHQPQAQALRERIEQGLNWYELVPVLDDLAVLMLAVADLGQREFESYLALLNDRLATMQDNLEQAREGHVQTQRSADTLDAELRMHVDGLQSSMQQATDLQGLKRAIEARLDGMLGTVDAYRQQRSEQEQVLGDRLQTLVDRVASLEETALGLRSHLEEQREKALRDSLTGLGNRAAWNERLELEVARWHRSGGNLLLAVLDIDHFKRVNDVYGHLAGDRVLKIIASVLRKRLRKTDFIARFGGEEFVLLLPDTDEDAGRQLADTLRAGIESCPFHFKGERVQITTSVGLSAFRSGDSAERVFERADQALYRAKHGGRNRVELG
ncbi:GGDEF domain-containing protein [Stutzerimonas nosocomialis]|uniref:diguanylate cyclase n=1 Tax=Stutzerimonas nosocomialis TaxID=1056496 RepID=A0A5R9QAQ3_9GAMM|nr:diguanylate cyclase [Stutzerimonas nosocomialis]TLX62206.1 GGDEF domain-containing protein [Stutzerimonas nosocomialis]